MIIFVYIGIGYLVFYAACYFFARSDVRRLERMNVKAIIKIAELKDEIDDLKLMYAEHRANQCVCRKRR